jgi:glyoxylate/hydroxypyruvate reductase A
VRLVDPALTELMVEYVIYWVIHHHRGFADYAARQREGVWRRTWPGQVHEKRVGIMGLGELGGAAAEALASLGFTVAGWSRTQHTIPGVEVFHGETGLLPFLNRTEILVCLLPLTPVTAGILDARALAALPAGACLINVARGEHLVEEDLLAALESGQVAAATLDVFRREPLPPDHPFWRHPQVTVTPHVASLTNTHTATSEIATDIRRLLAGQPPRRVVDVARGY